MTIPAIQPAGVSGTEAAGLQGQVAAAPPTLTQAPPPHPPHQRVVISDNSRHCVQAFDRLRVQREQARLVVVFCQALSSGLFFGT